MIDTLILRIHRIRKYRSILKSLDPADTKGFTTQTAKVDGKEFYRIKSQGNTNAETLDILKINRSGDYLIKTKFAKHQNASNHYTLSWMANYTADYFEFNFSIPKYVYGSNVLLFTDHIGDKNYSFHECWELGPNFVRAADRLERFLNEFFKQTFPFTILDYRDVEVNRIDVCFNQLFRSKAEALKYLEYQTRQRKKHSRNEEGVMRDYETSLMYKTKRYSAKIYHKGSEYQKNDLKEHLKINKEKGRQYFKTEEYQAFADKMLRYELTIRSAELNYLFKKNLFRRKCPHWQQYFKIYNEVENKKQRNDRIAKRIGELPEEEKKAYRKAHPYEKIDPEARKVYKWVSNTINKRTLFKLAVDQEVEDYNKGMVSYDCNEARFCRKLLRLCFEKLLAFIEEFQIKELPLEDQIGKLIEHYNTRHRKKLPKTDMMNFYMDLQRIGSFKDTAKHNFMSRATLYRYKQRFKKIGITENNLIPLTEAGIPQAELNLRDYHHELTFNPHFLNKKDFLEIF